MLIHAIQAALCLMVSVQPADIPKEGRVAPGLPLADKHQSPCEFEEIWSLDGDWACVFGDERTIVACRRLGDGYGVQLVTSDGVTKQIFEVKTTEQIRKGVLAQLDDDDNAEIILSMVNGPIIAIDNDGMPMWSVSCELGALDVAAADLDNDSHDEVIIGSISGVLVLDPAGGEMWRTSAIANAWSVDTIDIDGDMRPEVVSTSASGKVCFFDEGAGTSLGEPMAGLPYVREVRPLAVSDTARLLVRCSTSVLLQDARPETQDEVRCVDLDGGERWNRALDRNRQAVKNISLAETRPWAAIGHRDGSVCVVNLNDGSLVADQKLSRMDTTVAWNESGDDPLVLVATSIALRAFRVRERSSEK